MGIGPSVDLSVPPGGSMIMLQSPAECIQTKPGLTPQAKPPCLAMIDDARWNGFYGKLTSIVNGYWNELLPMLVVPVGALMMLLYIISQVFLTEVYVAPYYAIAPFFLCALIAAGGRMFVITKNCEQDVKLQQLCTEISGATNGQVTAQYRTAWTGFCKPKHARTARLIVFCPSGSIGAAQSILVQVPAGVQAGQQLQVPTPMGPQLATVPPGVGPGQTFSFTPGAPAAAPVVVAAEVIP